MNLLTLKYYKNVVESRSISKVAESESISQSALSQIIQRLEDELGHKLLKRSNKGVVPTDIGMIVYKYACTHLRTQVLMLEEIQSTMSDQHTVRINGYPSFINYSLPCVIHKVKKCFPNLHFELHSKDNEESISDIFRELTDISFVHEKPCDERLDATFIGKEKMVLVANKNLRIPEMIKVCDLNKYHFVLLNDSFDMRRFLSHRMPQIQGRSPLNILFEVDNIAAVKSALANHNCISILPYMSIKKELYDKELKIIQIQDLDIDYDIYLTTKLRNSEIQPLLPVIDYFIKTGNSDFC